MARNSISIYGCGGFGINIVRNFVNIPDDPERQLYPKTSIHAIDTSDSNLGASHNDIKHHVVPGIDGAGKNRKRAYEATLPHIATILNDHRPGIFNVVIFSTSGGKVIH
jgi:hypothetical protein